ncbi:MAG TPA: acyl-CoA reductase [Chitinophagaceae bacterium]|nr:acyl-CoA reductase [Chitinophagaceae bacterium]
MNLQMRITILTKLGQYILSDDPDWKLTKEKASQQNSWFTPEFIDLAVANIATQFLGKEMLESLTALYKLEQKSPGENKINGKQKSIGVIMAGNIPLVGFHDFLSVFITGHRLRIKASSKDEVLINQLVNKLTAWHPEIKELISFEEMLKGCDAYIATGSNNSSRYFEYYFSKYPHIIRRNRTSVAILDGTETKEELEALADDVHLYFGLGCRNVTKMYVPPDYEFIPLLEAFKKYNHLSDHFRYKNNYDYNLAIHILNNRFYMSNESIILSEDKSLFSPISQLNYEFFSDKKIILDELNASPDLQCIVGHGFLPFGHAQCPGITEFADGTDTIEFLTSL